MTTRDPPRRTGATTSAATEFLTRTLRCPACNTEFTTEIPCPPPARERDTDLRPRFDGADPLPSLIHSCPSCRYTAYREGYGVSHDVSEEDFDCLPRHDGDRQPAVMPVPDEDDLDELRRFIKRGDLTRGIAEGREPYGAERYLLGARCYEFFKDDDPVGLADYYLRAAWCARGAADRAQELACLKEAVQRFGDALDTNVVPEAEKPRTLFLVAELSRRVGDFARAVDLFTQLDTQPESDEDEGGLFAQLARRQLALAVVKSDVSGVITEEELDAESDEA